MTETTDYDLDARDGPWADAVPEDARLLAGLRNGQWLDGETFAPLRYAIPGLIPEGLSLFVGPPKIGKSWFVLAAALGIACGGRVLGAIPVARRPVLYLALEDGHRRLQDRCRQVLGDDPIPAEFEYLTTIMPGTALDTIRAWLRRHEGSEPVVLVDTLGRIMPPAQVGESAYQRDYRVGASYKQVVDDHDGASLVVVHHDRKAGSDDFVDSVSGTHGLAGSADSVIVLHRRRHESVGVVKVTGRDVPEGEYGLKLHGPGGWLLDGRTLEEAAAALAGRRATDGLDTRSASLVAVVNAHPDGISPKSAAEKEGIDSKTAGVYLGRLADSGRIQRLSRGKYAPSTHGVESVDLLNPAEDGGATILDFHTFNTPNTPTHDGEDE